MRQSLGAAHGIILTLPLNNLYPHLTAEGKGDLLIRLKNIKEFSWNLPLYSQPDDTQKRQFGVQCN